MSASKSAKSVDESRHEAKGSFPIHHKIFVGRKTQAGFSGILVFQRPGDCTYLKATARYLSSAKARLCEDVIDDLAGAAPFLSLVTYPVALYPATSESEKISFNQRNRQGAGLQAGPS